MPVMITRPLHPYMISIAFSKSSLTRSLSFNTEFASISSTSFAKSVIELNLFKVSNIFALSIYGISKYLLLLNRFLAVILNLFQGRKVFCRIFFIWRFRNEFGMTISYCHPELVSGSKAFETPVCPCSNILYDGRGENCN